MNSTLLALLAPLSVNTIWTGLFTVFLSLASPHLDKLEGPSTCLTIPGIELDSLNLQARLPQNKVDRITFVEDWSQKRWCKRKELESLIGHLQHACKIVLFLALNDQPAMRFSSWWPPDSSQWGVRSWPSLLARVSSSLGMVAASLKYPQWAPLPNFEVSSDALGLLVRRMAPNTGLSVYQVQRTFPYLHGSLPLGSPTGHQTGQLPIR